MSGAVGDLGSVSDGNVSTIRMTLGATPKVSIMDFAMEVTGRNNDNVGKTIRNMVNENPDFFENLEKFKFSGRGQTEQYVLCCSECVELMMMLPGKRAVQFRMVSASLLTRLFEGDPTLQDLIAKNGLSANPLEVFVDYVKDMSCTIPLSESGGESEAHEECKEWIAANINCLSFATAVCPGCSVPVLGLGVAGGLCAVEEMIPGTNYRADVVVRLHAETYVAIEVAHTHLISAKKMFECKQAGNIVYEVETKDIKRAMMEHCPFSTHILYTTCTESVLCSRCK
jgi:hypothetical protein